MFSAYSLCETHIPLFIYLGTFPLSPHFLVSSFFASVLQCVFSSSERNLVFLSLTAANEWWNNSENTNSQVVDSILSIRITFTWVPKSVWIRSRASRSIVHKETVSLKNISNTSDVIAVKRNICTVPLSSVGRIPFHEIPADCCHSQIHKFTVAKK